MPVFRERPYRILKPPDAPGKAKIGRPPTTSSMNMNSFASSPSDDEVFIIASHPQPSSPSFSTIFRTLVDRPSSPSFTTRSAPPRTRFVSMRIRFRLTDTSTRSEEHTSELQSLAYLVCRLLLEKKKTI